MANRKRQDNSRRNSSFKSGTKRKSLRKSLVETLEPRKLLAGGPQLIGIQPNSGDLIDQGTVRDVSPRELVFRFDENQAIDSSTLDGIRIVRSGGDGTFQLPVGSSDFGSAYRDGSGTLFGGVDIQLTGLVPGQPLSVSISRDDALPTETTQFAVNFVASGGATVQMTLGAGTTAGGLVDAINASPELNAVLSANIKAGHRGAELMLDPAVTTLPDVEIVATGDERIIPSVLTVDAQNSNEVVARFSGALPDDDYKIEIFGFDDPDQGIVGLRSLDTVNGNPFFQPSVVGARTEEVRFSLDLGARVSAVVPQPVVRLEDGSIAQRRNEVVVYFNDDDLFVENDGGLPTERSAENPRFYSLIFTQESVNNIDDIEIAPSRVVYNPGADTATLIFGENEFGAPLNDLSDLLGGQGGEGTFRLRVGTAEPIPISPQRVELGNAVGATDLNAGGDGLLRFQAVNGATDVQLDFSNTGVGGIRVNVVGSRISVDLGGSTTLGNVASALNGNVLASALVQTTVDGVAGTSVGSSAGEFASVSLLEPGDTFTAAASLGEFGVSSGDRNFRSILLSGAIEPIDYRLELPGGNDDPGHRDLGDPDAFDQHINPSFGADSTPGIGTIPYNFQEAYGVDSSGAALNNAISDPEKARIREALDLWSRNLGVQFYETDSQGITFATGELSVLNRNNPNTNLQSGLGFGVRIDPQIATNAINSNAILVMNALRSWDDNYGEDYFRTATAAIGMLLGLAETPDLPSSTLLNLDGGFLGNNSGVEPVFPGNYDILHGQNIWRPESGDIDLYRFEINLDDPDKLAIVSVETFAERLTESSLLDTALTLYEETQASVRTDFGVFGNFEIEFTSTARGLLGNRTGVTLVTTPSGNPAPLVQVDGNQISVFMTDPASVTVEQLVDAINASPASQLVTARLIQSQDVGTTPTLATLQEDSPTVLLGGGGIFPVARNDDYFSEDSFLEAELSSGIYYVGVTAAGNESPNPDISETGFGGTTEGEYDLLIKFRPQVDETDVLRDMDGNGFGTNLDFPFPGSRLDGDNDGREGGVNNFWFQSRPLDRRLEFVGGGDTITNGDVITLTDFRGITRRLQFSLSGTVGPNRIPIVYTASDTPEQLAGKVAAAIRDSGLQITQSQSGATVSLTGEQTLEVPDNFVAMKVLGRTIFVDNLSGPNADGSLSRPFDSIAGLGIPNAFEATHPGDIVRIVGNGGFDMDPATLGDNFAYEVGFGDLGGTLQDGTEIEVPQGVTTMIDANAIFRMRRSYVGVGSSNVLNDRSEGVLQVLGTPTLIDSNGAVLRDETGQAIDGSVYFTSHRDRTIGAGEPGIPSIPEAGDWGGIRFRRDVDRVEGNLDLEDQGIFLQHVGHANIQYGGGGNVVIDGIQQLVNPIDIVDMRPRIAENQISNSADAAISATPDSFTETNFQSPSFQIAGAFTSDYDRVGPDVYGNALNNNSINGMFIRAVTPVGGNLRNLTVAGRFDDIDVVHVLAENLIVEGTPGGPIVLTEKPATDIVTVQPLIGGSLVPGNYTYRVSFVDKFGNEGLPSDATSAASVSGVERSVALTGIPPAEGDFILRRVYRSRTDGRFDLVGILDASEPTFTDGGGVLSIEPVTLDLTSTERRASRPDASLKIDPGAVVKLQGARIEFQFGTQLLAEGLDGQEIVFTSLLDDRYGVGGEFDTNNDGGVLPTGAGDWGGLYFAPNSHASIDHAIVSFAGGLTRIEGTFKSFAPIELHQATARITNTEFSDNEDGQGGQGPVNRFGRLDVTPSTIFVRGSQPVIVGNTFERNAGSIIDIDGNSMTAERVLDLGRDTGQIDRLQGLDDNHGPLIRQNRLEDNGLNGLEIRGRDQIFVGGREFTSEQTEYIVDSEFDTVNDGNNRLNTFASTLSVGERLGFGEIAVPAVILTTESVWDDTDIVHVPFQQIIVGNLHSSSGLRLQSRPDQSLVVKFSNGPGAVADPYFGNGITATGTFADISDRVGGSVHVVGLPNAPVVLTSLSDDSVGASLFPDGTQHTDTNNDRWGSRPEPNDWRSVLLDEFSNDRNVEIVLELEAHDAPAPGLNGNTINPQVLGDLASSELDSNDVFRMGFEVEGFLSTETDVDVYSFSALAGSEVWIDIDRTSMNTDTVIELLDAEGNLLLRSDNSTEEVADPSLIDVVALRDEQVGSLQKGTAALDNFNGFGLLDEYGTTNIRDAGVRVSLPGVRGARSPYFVRVRSQSVNPDDFEGGTTKGAYKLQIRNQEEQEFPGSTVRFADIRYAKHGVVARGLPRNSLLTGEAQEDELVRGTGTSLTANFTNNSLFTGSRPPVSIVDPVTGFAIGQDIGSPGDRAQYVGNLLDSDKGVISIGGTLESGVGGGIAFSSDVDFFQFDVKQTDPTAPRQLFPAIFDVDYADGFGRPDTNISVFFDPDGQSGATPPQLVLFSEDSNIAEDRQSPLGDAVGEEFARGSVGAGDPFIGTVGLPEGTYFAAVTPKGVVPADLRNNPDTRREPVNSVVRIVDDQIESAGGSTAADPVLPRFFPETLEAGWQVTGIRGTDPGHGRLTSFDQSRVGGAFTSGEFQGEFEPNNSLSQAQNLDLAAPFWSLNFNSNIDDFNAGGINTSTTTPHTTVSGTMTDLADVYSFTVTQPSFFHADIDNGLDFTGLTGGASVNTDLLLINQNGILRNNSDITFDPNTPGRLDAGTLSAGDPFLPNPDEAPLLLQPGQYFLAVVPNFTVYNSQTRTFTNTVGTPSAGSYELHVSLQNHPTAPVGSTNESLRFAAANGAGSQRSNAFNLAGYTAEDLPRLYFNYFLSTGGNDDVNVRVFSDQDPAGSEVAANNPIANEVLTEGDWRQAVISLEEFAGHTGVTVEFNYTALGVGGEGLFLDDFIVGFAERGELITGGSLLQNDGSALFVSDGNFGNIVTGEYQLEIRAGSDIGDTVRGALQLTNSFDTNDRLEEAVTLVAPAGFRLADGDFFEIGDGFESIEFEFDDVSATGTPGVSLRRTRVPFRPDMTSAEIARAIIEAINNPAVQSQLDVKAASSGGIESGDTLGDARVNLFGNVTGDFAEIAVSDLAINSAVDPTSIAQRLVGSGIQVTGNASTIGSVGVFDGGSGSVGLENGIVLSTGNLSSVLGPNVSSFSSTNAAGFGDTDIDAIYDPLLAEGVSTVDHSALEFSFQFEDTAPATSSLYLEFVFASEEYSDDALVIAPDLFTVLMTDDTTGDLVPISLLGDTQVSTRTLPSSSGEITNNDPASGGLLLNEIGLDGLSRILRIEVNNIDPTLERTIRIGVADNFANVGDTAVFLRAGSLSAVDPGRDANLLAAADQRLTLPAKVHLGNGDTNRQRQQGQLLVHSNFISDVQVYGVWLDNADRDQDPEDFRADGSPSGFAEGLPHIGLGQPNLGPSYSGAIRNLRQLNDIVEGGITPGAVVFNNVIDQAGVSGVVVSGALAPFMIDADSSLLVTSTPDQNLIAGEDVHFGDLIEDGTLLTIDAGQTRVVFEFEDLSGDVNDGVPNINRGSTALGGDGVGTGNVPIYYRKDATGLYNPSGPTPHRNYGGTEHETLLSIYDAIIGSILVTNDLVSLVDVTIGPSLVEDSISSNQGGGLGPFSFGNPALYIEGATSVVFSGPHEFDFFDAAVGQAPIHEVAQPFARVINNTIYGEDGTLSDFSEAGTDEPNDTIEQAIITGQGRAHSPQVYTTSAVIGDSSVVSALQDVDFYQIELAEGDRVEINVNTVATATLDTTVSLIDASGRVVAFSDDDPAPGEVASTDSFLDFTAINKGTYYVAVSGNGNVGFDPLSLAGRVDAGSSGSYDIDIEVHAPREFVITAEDAAFYAPGDSFTIVDVTGAQTTFVFGGGGGPGTVPIQLNASFRPWDMARAIADAINGATAQGQLQNHARQNGPGGLSGPIQAVEATPLGGIEGDQAGVDNIGGNPLSNDGLPNVLRIHHPLAVPVADSQRGFGHDRLASSQSGTSEQFVVIERAARIINNNAIILDPTPGTNVDQLLPESGIQVIQGASPTLLNNVIINTHVGIYDEVTRRAGFGSNGTDVHPKPNDLIVGGNLFQGVPAEDVVPQMRSLIGDGIERGPSNITAGSFGTLDDFNVELPIGQRVLTNPAGGNFIPSPGSFAIDSSISSLAERERVASLLNGLGIAVNPVIAPERDAFGLLRVDDHDPLTSTPPGLGENVFIDRGAVDLADFIGPSATLVSPLDNEPGGSDADATTGNVDWRAEPPTEFRIRLEDIADAADPFVGTGIDNTTVVNSVIDGIRSPGAVVTLFENGDLLEEGVDYTFRFDATSELIILTPLAGAWRSDAVYQIGINNRDRFVLLSPSGSQIADGNQFTVLDSSGGTVTFEYDTGYQLQMPSDINLQIPLAGGGAGGVQDGDRIRITSPDGLTVTTFEMDRDGSFINGNIPISFVPTDSQAQIVDSINSALAESISFPVLAIEDQGAGVVAMETRSGTTVAFESTSGSPVVAVQNTVSGATLTIASPGELFDGDLIRITTAGTETVFEVDLDNEITSGNTRLTVINPTDQQQIATAITETIRRSLFPIESVQQIGDGTLFLAAAPGTLVETGFSNITQPSASLGLVISEFGFSLGGVADGDTFTIDSGGQITTFEFDNDNVVAPNNIQINITTLLSVAELPDAIVAAIQASGIAANPQVINDRVVFLGLTEGAIVTTQGTGVSTVGVARPLQEGDGFTLSQNGTTVEFQYTLGGGAFERDVNGDGQLDIRLPVDINNDGVIDDHVLVDTNNDGVFDEVRIEADGLATAIDPVTNQPVPDFVIAIDADLDGVPDRTVIKIPVQLAQPSVDVATNTAAAIEAQGAFGLAPTSVGGGLISVGGEVGLQLTVNGNSPLIATGAPGVANRTTLEIAGPLVLGLPSVGGVGLPDGSNFTIDNNGQVVTFEFDAGAGQNDPNAIPIPYTLSESADIIAATVATVISGAGLGLLPTTLFGGQVLLDGLDEDQVTIPINNPISKRRGTVNDGESITITDGARSVTFEFENAVGGGGVSTDSQGVVFSPTGNSSDVAISLGAAIQNSILQIQTQVVDNQIVLVGDNPRVVVDTSNTASVQLSGVAGGSVPVKVVRSSGFSDVQVRNAIIDAVNNSGIDSTLTARTRGDGSLFLEGATTVDASITNYFLGAVTDPVGNELKSNQLDDTVTFTILLSGAQFDYGDAPDPVENVPGRYPTSRENNGARHLIPRDAQGNVIGPLLGSLVDPDSDGQPQRNADGDDTSLVVSSSDRNVFDIIDGIDGPVIRVGPAGTLPSIYEGEVLTVNNGLQSITFEIDSDGMFDEDNIRIPFDGDTDANKLVGNLAAAIRASGIQLSGLRADRNELALIADDEDGFVIGTPDSPTLVLRKGAPTNVQVNVTGSGLLDGWIDFNRDGDWDDPGERIFTNLPVSEADSPFITSITIPQTTPVLSDVSGVTTMARFRISTAGVSSPTGLALDGEVEDYSVRIVDGVVVANDDLNRYRTAEDNPLSVTANGVLANDAFRLGTTLSVFSEDVGEINLPGGTVDLRADGSFDFTPTPDFFTLPGQPISFTYRAVDQSLLDATGALLVTDPATVQIEVTPVNDPPVGATLDQLLSTAEDFPLTVSTQQLLGNLTVTTTDDFRGGPANENQDDTLRIGPSNSTTTSLGGRVRFLDVDDDGTVDQLIYEPPFDVNSVESGLDQFSYQVIDDQGGTVEVSVSVNIGEANDPPILINQSNFNTDEDVNLSFTTDDLLNGASDPDGDNALLRVVSIGQASTRGRVVPNPDGTYVYIPPANFSGTDLFTYTVTDADFGTNTADVVVTVNPIPDAPEVQANASLTLAQLQEDAGSGFVNLNTLFTDADIPFGDVLSYEVIFVTPANVLDAIVTGPLLEIAPRPNQFTNGSPVNIAVRVSDSVGQSITETLLVSVLEQNDPPQVANEIQDQIVLEALPENTSPLAPIDLSQVFSDPDPGDLEFLLSQVRVEANTNPDLVNVQVVNGQLQFEFTPFANGRATILLEATDGIVAISEQFELTVLSRPNPPTATPDEYTVPRGGSIQVLNPSLGLLANDEDVDGDSFQIIGFTQPSTGTLSVDGATGGFVYTNTSGATGSTDFFTYTLQDSTLRQSTGQVTLNIGDPLLTHHNPIDGMDVNADTKLSPIDALLVINLLNRTGVGSIPVRSLDPSPPYYDASADANVTALDALVVINELNRRANNNGTIESEMPVSPSMFATSVIAGTGAVNSLQPVTPVAAEILAEEATPVRVDSVVDQSRFDRLEMVLDTISVDDRDDDDDLNDSVDAAIDQLLGDINGND